MCGNEPGRQTSQIDLEDAYEELPPVTVAVPIEIRADKSSVTIRVLNQAGDLMADVYVEHYNDEVVAYIWDEKTTVAGSDPVKIVLIKNTGGVK